MTSKTKLLRHLFIQEEKKEEEEDEKTDNTEITILYKNVYNSE